MIITKELEIKVQCPTLNYYRTLNYDVSVGDVIKIPIEHLKKSSNLRVLVSCDSCFIEKECFYNAYNKQVQKSDDGKYRCIKCSIPYKSNKKWGVDHYSKTDDFKKKFKETCESKYGGHFNKLDDFKKKIVNTNVDRYGVNYPIQKKEIRDKMEQSMFHLYGSTHSLHNEFLRNKSLEKMIEKYGSAYSMQIPSIRDKIISSSKITKKNIFINKNPDIIEIDYEEGLYIVKCESCKNNFKITGHMYHMRKKYNTTICTICNNVGKSGSELQVYEFIKDNYNNEILQNKRNIVDNIELDIYLPDIKIAFEFNGLYWHSELYKEKRYHLNKTNICKEKNIELIHIWEDDWMFKKDIVKSIILNKLKKTSNKIFARNCRIKEISDNKLIREFLETNHIQGFVGSKIKIGLFYEDELVSLMTFGQLRISLGQKSEEGTYELLRFCNKLNTTVVGGASKLFKYFLDKYIPNKVISYSDYSRSNGNMYYKLGFNLEHNSEPNYFYIIDGIRSHRFNFRKDKLVREGANPEMTELEIMASKKIYRIFDCGTQKWIFY
jgi:hypothetical protein